MRLGLPTPIVEPAVWHFQDGRILHVYVQAPPDTYIYAAEAWAKAAGGPWRPWAECRGALDDEAREDSAIHAKLNASQLYHDERGSFRWVTVHPNGPGTKGQAIKIRESKTQPGVWHVVGGAGGKLNYLKLTNVKSVAEYKKQAGERRTTRNAEQKAARGAEEQRVANLSPEDRERELGRRGEYHAALATKEDETIGVVARALGWNEKEYTFDAEKFTAAGATVEQLERLKKKHRAEVIRRLDKLERNVVRRLLLDHEARAAMQLGDMPFSSPDPDVLALSDLDPDRWDKGLGYALDTAKLAEQKILQHLATARVDELDQQIADAQRDQAPTGDDGKLALMRQERDLAVLLRDHPELDLKDLHARDRELADTVKAIEAERQQYEPDLTALRDKAEGGQLQGDDHERLVELEAQAHADAQRLERVNELRETVAAVTTATGNVLASEQEAFRVERAAGRGVDADTYRKREDARQQKLAEYQAEVQRLKDAGAITKPDLSVDAAVIQDPDALLDIMRHMKALRQIRKQVKAVEAGDKPIDQVILGKPMLVDTREATKAEVDQAVRNELSERTTRSFLDEVEALDKDPTLADLTGPQRRQAIMRYVSLGSYNALNNAALTVLRAPVIPREVADVLGAAGTAGLLARVIQSGREPEDVMAVRDAIEQWHQANHVEAAQDAMAQSAALYDTAREIQIGQIGNVNDLREAQQLNAMRREKLEAARDVLGRTLGELEAGGALVAAMNAPPVDTIEVAMGDLSADMVIRQARALGLKRGDYRLDADGANRFLILNASALDSLSSRWLTPEVAAEAKQLDEVLAIKAGARDEDGWLPKGLKSWPRTAFDDPNYDVDAFSDSQWVKPIEQWGGAGDMEAWIGARFADGMEPDRILGDLNHFLSRAPESARGGIAKRRDELFPTQLAVTGKDGKPLEGQMRAAFGADHADRMAELAERFVGEHYGTNPEVSALHSQSLRLDGEHGQHATNALYVTLAEDPRALVAFKNPDSLNEQDAAAVRHYFATEIAKKQDAVDQDALAKRLATIDKDLKATPQYTGESQSGLFGGAAEKVVSPEYEKLQRQRQKVIADSQDAAGVDWDFYVHTHGNASRARAAIMDHMRDRFLGKFAKRYAAASGQKLRVGQTPMQGWQRHQAALDPAARAELRKERAELSSLQASVQTRRKGAFAEMGGVKAKRDRAARDEEWQAQNQAEMAGAERRYDPKAPHRATLGKRVESQIAALIEGQGGDGGLGRNFGRHLTEPVDMFPGLSMSGKANIKGTEVDLANQQRAIKMFRLRKRVGEFLGAGSGKTPISVGAFTDLASDPKTGVKRGLYVVPSHVQGQFHGEIARFVEPGKFNWNADPGADSEQRLAAHRDPNTHMMVTTYESLRGDTMKLLHEHAPPEARASEDTMRDWFMGLSRQERAGMVRQAFGGELPYQASFLDEGHVTLDRQGKADSLLSSVLQAYSDNTPYYMAMTADPLKNDISEIRSQLDKIHTDGRYSDEGEWMRRYGVGTTAQRDALRREVEGNFFVSSIEPPVQAHRQPVTVNLSEQQRADYKRVMNAYDKVRLAESRGELDVESLKQLAPESFEGVPEHQVEERAQKLAEGLPMTRDSALRRIVNLAPAEHNAKMQTIVQRLREKPPKDKPAVIFCHNPEAVEMLAATLKGEGHRVTTLTGAHSRKEKDLRRRQFAPKNPADAAADVMILSDAGATGLNLQRGKQLIHYDVPQTAMVHNQRNGRIHRLGQTDDVDLLDLVTDTDLDTRGRRLLQRKYDLKGIFTGDTGSVDESDLGHYLTRSRQARREQLAGNTARLAA